MAGGAREAAEDHGRPHDSLLTDEADEGRGHPDQLLGPFASFELAIAARQLDGDILSADRGRLLGVLDLERGHKSLRGG